MANVMSREWLQTPDQKQLVAQEIVDLAVGAIVKAQTILAKGDEPFDGPFAPTRMQYLLRTNKEINQMTKGYPTLSEAIKPITEFDKTSVPKAKEVIAAFTETELIEKIAEERIGQEKPEANQIHELSNRIAGAVNILGAITEHTSKVASESHTNTQELSARDRQDKLLHVADVLGIKLTEEDMKVCKEKALHELAAMNDEVFADDFQIKSLLKRTTDSLMLHKLSNYVQEVQDNFIHTSHYWASNVNGILEGLSGVERLNAWNLPRYFDTLALRQALYDVPHEVSMERRGIFNKKYPVELAVTKNSVFTIAGSKGGEVNIVVHSGVDPENIRWEDIDLYNRYGPIRNITFYGDGRAIIEYINGDKVDNVNVNPHVK